MVVVVEVAAAEVAAGMKVTAPDHAVDLDLAAGTVVVPVAGVVPVGVAEAAAGVVPVAVVRADRTRRCYLVVEVGCWGHHYHPSDRSPKCCHYC